MAKLGTTMSDVFPLTDKNKTHTVEFTIRIDKAWLIRQWIAKRLLIASAWLLGLRADIIFSTSRK